MYGTISICYSQYLNFFCSGELTFSFCSVEADLYCVGRMYQCRGFYSEIELVFALEIHRMLKLWFVGNLKCYQLEMASFTFVRVAYSSQSIYLCRDHGHNSSLANVRFSSNLNISLEMPVYTFNLLCRKSILLDFILEQWKLRLFKFLNFKTANCHDSITLHLTLF